MTRTRKLTIGAGVFALALVSAQFFEPVRANPPADPAASFQAVAKPRPEVAAIIGRACRDCHTNQTVWPWYSSISPMSWMVASDVSRGRAHLNFSQWNIYSLEMSQVRLKEVCGEVKAGKMPLPHYALLHPEAKLGSQDVETLCSAAK
jgi:hypothetical protein